MVTLPLVLKARENLKVVFHVQATHDPANQRDNVIDLMPRASLPRQARRFTVERLDRYLIRPYWSGLSLCRITSRDNRVDLVRIALGPLAIALFYMLLVRFSPVFGVGVSALLIACGPFSKMIRMLTLPVVAMSINAWLTASREVVGRGSVDVEGCKAFHGETHRASLESLCRQFNLFYTPSSRPGGVVGHWRSIWASTIRRTSSAIEMPRRLASRFKNWRCGSVNEIICLVIELRNLCEGSIEHFLQVVGSLCQSEQFHCRLSGRGLHSMHPVLFAFGSNSIGGTSDRHLQFVEHRVSRNSHVIRPRDLRRSHLQTQHMSQLLLHAASIPLGIQRVACVG